MAGETSVLPVPLPKPSRYRVWGVLAVVLGIFPLLYGADILLQVQGESLLAATPLPIPWTADFMDRYWELMPYLGWGMTIAGLALIAVGVFGFWKGGRAEATPINTP